MDQQKLNESEVQNPITTRLCQEEVIFNLYIQCQKSGKINGPVKVEVYLQNVDFPVDIGYKTRFLDALQKDKIIKSWELKTETENLPYDSLEISDEPYVDLFDIASKEDIENVPKDYQPIRRFESDYIVIVECEPKKILKHFQADFKRIQQKVEKATNKQKRFITKEGNDFFCEGKRIKFDDPKTVYYKLFNFMYGQDGRSAIYSRDDINKGLENQGAEKITDPKKIRKRINNTIDNLFRFAHFPQTLNQTETIKPRRKTGIEFNNPILPE